MRRSVTTTVAGSVLVLCAVLAAAVPVMTPEPYWSDALWLFIAGLGGAGLVVGLRPQMRRPAAIVAAVLAAQLAGHGTVAIRDLFNAQGAGLPGLTPHELASRVALAAVLALVGTVAMCVAVAVLWREPERGWRVWRPRRARLVVIGLGIVVVSAAPGLFASGSEMLTGAGQGLLYFGLPWGGGLAAAAWLGDRARRAAAGTVIASAAAALLSIAATFAGAALRGWT
jgi:hypothetical protein